MEPEERGKDGWWALVIFALLTLVYWHGRSLSFGGGDSPEHMVSCLTWGIPHPPGYPLYTLLGHLISQLPIGSPEGNVNGFSGLCNAAAAAFLFLLMRRLGLSIPASLTPAGLAAFSPLFWYYSEVAEVRSFNDLLAVLAAYFAVRFGQTKKDCDMAALTVVLGLGLSHHPTYVLILPAIGFWLWREGAWPRGRRAGLCALGVVGACALPYLVLWLRLQVSAPDYNHWEIRTWGDVLRHFMRSQTGGLWRMSTGQGLFASASSQAGFDFGALTTHARWLTGALWYDSGFAGLGLAVLGGAWLAAKRRQVLGFVGLWLGFGFGLCLLVISQQLHPGYPPYAYAVTARFYLLPFLALFSLAGFGVHWLSQGRNSVMAWLLLAAAVLPPALNPVNLKGHDSLLRYGQEILAGTRPGDIILISGDGSCFTSDFFIYVQHSAQGRVFLAPETFRSRAYLRLLRQRHPDLDIPETPADGISWDWKEWLRRNPSRNLYAEVNLSANLPQQFPGTSPKGVLIAALRKRPPAQALAAEARRFLAETSTGRLALSDLAFRTQEISMALVNRGLLLAYDSTLADRRDAALRAEIRRRLGALEP